MIESGLLEAKESIHELEKNYILDDYTITIEDDYNQFQSIVDDLAEITKIIETKDFSYIEMIDDFSRIVEQSKPYNDSLIKHIELAETLRIQVKRELWMS